MRGGFWLRLFGKVMDKMWKEFSDNLSDSEWTQKMKTVLDEVAKMSNCRAIM